MGLTRMVLRFTVSGFCVAAASFAVVAAAVAADASAAVSSCYCRGCRLLHLGHLYDDDHHLLLFSTQWL